MPLSQTERRRFSRQIALPEMGVDGQEKLQQARVLVIGAGGLGSLALTYLAAAGIGKLGIIDPDTVNLSNLPRQILFEEGDIGRPKVEAAKDRLSELHSDTRLDLMAHALDESNAESIISRYDLVLDGCDNFETRHQIARHCYHLKKPLISGAVSGWMGQISVFTHQNAALPCYGCLTRTQTPDAENCAEAGIIGPVAGVIASLQTQEVIKYLTGAGKLLQGEWLIYDGLKSKFRSLSFTKSSICPICFIS